MDRTYLGWRLAEAALATLTRARKLLAALVVVSGAGTIPVEALAQLPTDFPSATTAVSAFGCSALADEVHNAVEATRLRDYGVAQARAFLTRYHPGTLSHDQLSKLPLYWVSALRFLPSESSHVSPDFIVGSLFASVR
jgi:hypothetical protein